MVVRVRMVRHGETENNIARVMQGWCDSALTELGVEQAHKVGKKLADVLFAAAYASDLPRQQTTAKIILEENRTGSVPELTIDWRFREIGCGSLEANDIDETYKKVAKAMGLEGKTPKEIHALHTRKEIYRYMRDADPEGLAETGEMCVQRVMDGLRDLAKSMEKEYPDRDSTDALVVCSGSAMGLLLDELDPEMRFSHVVHNADSIVTEIENGTILLTEHDPLQDE